MIRWWRTSSNPTPIAKPLDVPPESHVRRKASERATLHLIIARVDKPRGGDVAQGFPFWFRSTLHAGEPHGGLCKLRCNDWL